jgi:excisionase family DNA binding protein
MASTKERASANPKRELPTRDDALLTRPEVADMLGVTVHWVNRALAQHRFPQVKVGKLVRVRRADVLAYIEAQSIPAQDGR